jgi:hypothetical protein
MVVADPNGDWTIDYKDRPHGETLAFSVKSLREVASMTVLHHAIGKGAARWGQIAAVTALVCLPMATLPALAAWQPSSTYTSDRTAYDHAIAVGTTSALHNFIVAYPDSPLADKALELLVQHCTTLKPQASGEQYSDSSCDLQSLITPAAGPNTDTAFTDPPNEHSFKDNASAH